MQKLNATIRDDGIIDKLKHTFSRDAEGIIPSSTKAILCKDDENFMVAAARYVDHFFNLFLLHVQQTNFFSSFELKGLGGLLVPNASKAMNVTTDAKYMPGELVVP